MPAVEVIKEWCHPGAAAAGDWVTLPVELKCLTNWGWGVTGAQECNDGQAGKTGDCAMQKLGG